MNRPVLTEPVRRRLYEVAIAGVVVAVAYGLVEGDKATLWLALVAAVLGVARTHVPSGPDDDGDHTTR